MMRVSKIYTLLFVFAVVFLSACSRYTAPSPIDGAWRMVKIENRSGLELPIPAESVPYWDFSNVLYSVGYQVKGGTGVRRMGYGNLYFQRDQMTLKANNGEAHFFPVPSTEKLTEISFTYRVWNGKLTLSTPDYTIYLEKK